MKEIINCLMTKLKKISFYNNDKMINIFFNLILLKGFLINLILFSYNNTTFIYSEKIKIDILLKKYG